MFNLTLSRSLSYGSGHIPRLKGIVWFGWENHKFIVNVNDGRVM